MHLRVKEYLLIHVKLPRAFSFLRPHCLFYGTQPYITSSIFAICVCVCIQLWTCIAWHGSRADGSVMRRTTQFASSLQTRTLCPRDKECDFHILNSKPWMDYCGMCSHVDWLAPHSARLMEVFSAAHKRVLLQLFKYEHFFFKFRSTAAPVLRARVQGTAVHSQH